MDSMATQLRRYTMVDGVWDEFRTWWHDELVPVRDKFGFTIEFAYRIDETNEFIWAVSAPGDADDFARAEQAYLASDERAAAFAGRPTWNESTDIRLVEPIPAH